VVRANGGEERKKGREVREKNGKLKDLDQRGEMGV